MVWSEIVPELDLRHLKIMTDDVGLAQHAIYGVPDRRHGYCTDDNARALIAALWHWELRQDPEVWPLISTYLAFLVHAFNEGPHRFRNFMSYSREWLEDIGSDDSHSRAILGMGGAIAILPHESALGPCIRLFNEALPALETFTSVRANSLAIVGIDSYLTRFPGHTAAQRMLRHLAEPLLKGFVDNATDDWPWLEDLLTWGNARIPHALLLASNWLDSAQMLDTGLRALQWLLEIQTAPAGHLTIIGNQGWYPRGGDCAHWDQQPIEVAVLAEACAAAYNITRDRSWLAEIRRCLEWFLGRNDLGVPLYDSSTGGSRDGLNAGGVNVNQGAESTLAWLTTLLLVHKLQASEALFSPPRPQTPIELQNRII